MILYYLILLIWCPGMFIIYKRINNKNEEYKKEGQYLEKILENTLYEKARKEMLETSNFKL